MKAYRRDRAASLSLIIGKLNLSVEFSQSADTLGLAEWLVLPSDRFGRNEIKALQRCFI